MSKFAERGSQRWLQIAINRRPTVLPDALRESGAVSGETAITWSSPLESDGFREYRDKAALEKAEIRNLRQSLDEFWPARGPVWDAIGITSQGNPMFVEAKAHIPEAASPASKASAEKSRKLIEQSLGRARKFYAPRATANWNNLFYQYANRLAHHYYLRRVNRVPSTLVFLYFLNASDMLGPMSRDEWHGAIRLIHAVLGLPQDLRGQAVFDVFLDTRSLTEAVK